MIGLGEMGNRFGDRCRKHQCTTGFRRGGEDEFEIFAKAHIEHFVGFIENNGPQIGQIKRALVDVVAEATGSTHNDMRTLI